MYNSIKDAQVAMDNSGVQEWFVGFSDEKMDSVIEWMWRNDKSPEQAAEFYKVA